MIKISFNNKYFDILDTLSLTKGTNEVAFDDITIDFTGYSINDLPQKYQEIKVIDINNDETLYYGFLDSYKINNRKNEDEDVELSMTLLTPMKMATIRYVSIYGSYTLDNLIRLIIDPLMKDGFNLMKVDIDNYTYKVNWTLKTVDNAMNIICNIYNMWWFIDEKKNIYVYSINKLLNKDAKISITKDNIPSSVYSLTPELDVEKYANQLSIKNARVVRRAEGCGVGTNAYPRIFFDRLSTLYPDEEYTFDNPIVFYKPNEYKTGQILFALYTNKYAIFVWGMTADGTIKGEYYTNPVYQYSNGEIAITSYTKRVVNKGMAIQADGSDTEEDSYLIIFKRDSFFKNLITGFKFKGAKSTISYPNNSPYTDTALVYEVYTVKDEAEISRKKGIISDSGIVEDIIDANEKWFKESEIHEFAISQFEMYKGNNTKVVIETDEDIDINVGDLVNIDTPEFFISNMFVCSKITNKIINEEYIDNKEWQLEFINAEINSTFIDMFRPKDSEEDSDRTIYHVLGVYSTEEVHEEVDIEKDVEE